jgi:putative membrane protein
MESSEPVERDGQDKGAHSLGLAILSDVAILYPVDAARYRPQPWSLRQQERPDGVCPARIERRRRIMKLLLHWLLSALALVVVSHLVPGFYVTGFVPALVAALVIGLLNATVGLVLKIVTFPISILTLGLFLLVINGLMILLASAVVRGFHVSGLLPATIGAAVLALLGMLIRAITSDK